MAEIAASAVGDAGVEVRSVYGNGNGRSNEIADTTLAGVAWVPSCGATWVATGPRRRPSVDL